MALSAGGFPVAPVLAPLCQYTMMLLSLNPSPMRNRGPLSVAANPVYKGPGHGQVPDLDIQEGSRNTVVGAETARGHSEHRRRCCHGAPGFQSSLTQSSLWGLNLPDDLVHPSVGGCSPLEDQLVP